MITKLFPYINFEGEAREAAQFYTEVLGAELLGISTYGETPGADSSEIPDEAKNMVMNAQLKLKNGDVLMISDVPPGMGMPFQKGNSISLTVTTDDIEEAKTLFGKLSEGGSVTMELQETFWSPMYGNLTDKFGTDWQISVDGEDS